MVLGDSYSQDHKYLFDTKDEIFAQIWLFLFSNCGLQCEWIHQDRVGAHFSQPRWLNKLIFVEFFSSIYLIQECRKLYHLKGKVYIINTVGKILISIKEMLFSIKFLIKMRDQKHSDCIDLYENLIFFIYKKYMWNPDPKVFEKKEKELFPVEKDKPKSVFPTVSPIFPGTSEKIKNPFENKNPVPANNTELVQFMKRELQERDRRIQNLQLQVKTLSNAVNMCMMHITEKNKNPSFPQKKQDPFNQPPQPKSDNPLEHIAPITLIGSQVVHSDGQIKLHRPIHGDLSNVLNIKIQNNFGKIIFKEPINLLKSTKRLSEAIKIENSNIRIMQDEWKNKQSNIVLYNFKHYLEVNYEEKQNIIAYVESMKEGQNKKMQVVEFDMELGNLYLNSSGI